MGKFIEQIGSLWARLELPQKVTLVLVVLGLVVVASLVVVGVRTPDYRVLAKGLARAQVSEIAAYLDAQRVPYRVVDNESTIMVPSAQLYTLRNVLAEQEMLTDGSSGFELLAEAGFGQSSFREQKTYDRAVAGELERSFRELPGVRNARVIINRPPPSPFLVDDRSASAAVKLEMQSGRRLSDRQLAGVIHLTTGAVEGLQPDRVQVVDGSGLLSRPADEDGAGMAMVSTRLEAARAKEVYLTQKAQSMLDSVLGPGRSLVQVAVDLDFTRRSEAESTPTGIQPLRIVSSTQDERTPVPLDAGVVGTLPNVEGEGMAQEAAVFGTRASETETRENVVGKRQSSVEHETGRIRGMTVSILLDEKIEWVEEEGEAGQPATRSAKRREYDEAERQRFQDMVLTAIGYDAARGAEQERAQAPVADRFTVSIQSMALHREEPLPEMRPSASTLLAEWGDALRYAVAAVVALVLLLVARGQLRRSQASIESETLRRRRAQEDVAKVEADKARMTGVASAEMEKRSELRDQIRREVEADPDAAATVLKAWIHDGR